MRGLRMKESIPAQARSDVSAPRPAPPCCPSPAGHLSYINSPAGKLKQVRSWGKLQWFIESALPVLLFHSVLRNLMFYIMFDLPTLENHAPPQIFRGL